MTINLDCETAVEARGLWHIYQPIGHVALKDINLTIRKGEFVALIGQNGSGKTTLIKHFNGLLKPSRGEMLIGGEPVKNQKVSDLAHFIGYVFQNPAHQIFSETVEEEVSFGPKNLGYDAQKTEELVTRSLVSLELDALRKEMPFMLGRGQMQRLAVASILAMDPQVLIIDEPTTGLDWRESVCVLELVKKLNEAGHTIIMTTHNMSLTALYAKRVVVLRLGEKILDGPVNEVFQETEALKSAYIKPPQVFRLMSRFPFIKARDFHIQALADEICASLKKEGVGL